MDHPALGIKDNAVSLLPDLQSHIDVVLIEKIFFRIPADLCKKLSAHSETAPDKGHGWPKGVFRGQVPGNKPLPVWAFNAAGHSANLRPSVQGMQYTVQGMGVLGEGIVVQDQDDSPSGPGKAVIVAGNTQIAVHEHRGQPVALALQIGPCSVLRGVVHGNDFNVRPVPYRFPDPLQAVGCILQPVVVQGHNGQVRRWEAYH